MSIHKSIAMGSRVSNREVIVIIYTPGIVYIKTCSIGDTSPFSGSIAATVLSELHILKPE
jgi:hypothetical protein